MEKTELKPIPYVRRVYYDTYANLPTTGLKIMDLGFATDRKTLYRWNGTSYDPITIYADSGTAANKPNAANLPDGSLYYETDTYLLKQVQSGAWADAAIYSRSGTAANKPNAANVPEGSLYYETDTSILKQVQSGAWVSVTGVSFTELAGTEGHGASSADTWEDWDLSAIVPAGTKSVLVAIKGNSSTNRGHGARKNGSALTRRNSSYLQIEDSTTSPWLTEVDANRVIEIYAEADTNTAIFGILGYWS